MVAWTTTKGKKEVKMEGFQIDFVDGINRIYW